MSDSRRRPESLVVRFRVWRLIRDDVDAVARAVRMQLDL
jgi:hypothetical protein